MQERTENDMVPVQAQAEHRQALHIRRCWFQWNYTCVKLQFWWVKLYISHLIILFPSPSKGKKKKSCLNKPPLYEMRLKRIKDIILVENLIKWGCVRGVQNNSQQVKETPAHPSSLHRDRRDGSLTNLKKPKRNQGFLHKENSPWGPDKDLVGFKRD